MLCCGKSKKPFSCEVELLNGTHANYSKNQNVKITTKVQVVFDSVCLKLNLVEKDYFGLCYYDNNSIKHWLDLNKAFCDDTVFMTGFNSSSCLLYFGVKFYAADPCSLKEEVTRYQFFLQLRKDILDGKLTCSFKKAAEVSALALQSEIGDYHANEHSRGYVSEFRFLPNQNEKFEAEVARLHATYKGLVPAIAEMQYLRKCRQFDLYGVELHAVRGDAGMQYSIGISTRGIETFKNKYRITIYYWPRIESIDFKDLYLKLQVKNKRGEVTVHSFQLASPSLCQHVWNSIVEHHVFYRLPQNIPTTTWSKKHRYSGRTEAELLQSEVEREEPEVERGSSKRYPARINHTSGDNDKENNEVKITKQYKSQGEEANWNNVLGKKGMFNMAESANNNTVKYMTPKNERRERNRQLQTLSDTENRNRRHRSRGRSSGDESDSPSKRRIRARRQNRSNIGSDVSESSHVRRRRRKYHTDTEMANGMSEKSLSKRGNNVSTSHARRSKRLSKDDITARQQLWQHIQRDVVDPSDKSPEELRDIPYTEVKTEGTPHHIKIRHHHRRHHSSSKRGSGVSASSYTQALEEGMIPPLPVTTSAMKEQHTFRYGRHHQSPNKAPGKDWDTRTSLSMDAHHSTSTSNPHRVKHRRSKDSGLTLVYSQI